MAHVTPPGYETLREVRRRDLWEDDGSKLAGLLVAGRLQAYRVDRAGIPHPISKEHWQTVRIDEMEEAPVFLKTDLDREIPDKYANTTPGRRAQRLIEKAKAAQREESAPAAAPKNRGGHPTNYDWDAMWIEVVRIVLLDAFPKRPAELRNRLHDWFAKTGRKIPGDTMMKEKMRALFAVIYAEENEGSNGGTDS
jgi:hypothetical protein